MALVGKFELHVNAVTEEITKHWLSTLLSFREFQLWKQNPTEGKPIDINKESILKKRIKIS